MLEIILFIDALSELNVDTDWIEIIPDTSTETRGVIR